MTATWHHLDVPPRSTTQYVGPSPGPWSERRALPTYRPGPAARKLSLWARASLATAFLGAELGFVLLDVAHRGLAALPPVLFVLYRVWSHR